MRIIAGKYRGRKLKGPRGRDLRPTGDRLKVTLFNIMGPSIRDKRVLDVFAGTGAIGLEALSRGAREVIFIESSQKGCRLIRENLQLCGVTGRYQILNYDAFTALRFLSRGRFCFDTVFLDPPYEWHPYRDLLEVIFRTGLVHADSRVIVEHHRRAVLPQSGEDYLHTRTVSQSDKCLSFYRLKSNGE